MNQHFMRWTILITTTHSSIPTQRMLMLALTLAGCFQFTAAETTTHAREIDRQLQRKVSVTWQGQTLAAALSRLARAGGIDLWIDRRVDREKSISVEVADLSLEQTLRDICAEHDLGIATPANLVYIGPRNAAEHLTDLIDTARQPVRALPSALRRRWLQAKPTEWPRLSEPRQLVESWISEANLKLIGEDRIPHDLWPDQSLPPTSLVDRLVIVLAGFELTCQIAEDGKSCEIVPLKLPASSAQPGASVAKNRPGPSRDRSNSRPGRQVFTLRLENQPLGQVLDHLAKQMDLTVDWPAATEPQDRLLRVSCDVSRADFDELLTAILRDTSLRYRQQGNRIRLEAKP